MTLIIGSSLVLTFVLLATVLNHSVVFDHKAEYHGILKNGKR